MTWIAITQCTTNTLEAVMSIQGSYNITSGQDVQGPVLLECG